MVHLAVVRKEERLDLVSDIGGTNSRFALCRPGTLDLIEPRKYPNAEFKNLENVIEHYCEETGYTPQRACIAIAGPVLSDFVRLSNIDWSFSARALAEKFNWSHVEVTNDFTALAMSVPHEPADNVIQVGTGTPAPYKPISVLGPGTGLGVSGLLWAGDHWIPMEGEGGNVAFSPTNELEIELLRYALRSIPFVTAEHFLSGRGLTLLHSALLEINGRPAEELPAATISKRAKEQPGSDCHHTINLFCGMLGAFAGDRVMTVGALGGAYIGGGVVPQLEHLFAESPFRQRFDDKGKFYDYIKGVPTYVLLSHSRAALIGAAAILNKKDV